MKLLSVSVGSPRQIEWKGKLVKTSIFKFPRAGPVRVTKLNLNGDEQSDLSVHGGIDKAVYAYPSEHYPFWREELARPDLSWDSSERTSQLRDCWKPLFILVTPFELDLRSLLCLNRDCHASSSAYASASGHC
jgi:hypothetical protein